MRCLMILSGLFMLIVSSGVETQTPAAPSPTNLWIRRERQPAAPRARDGTRSTDQWADPKGAFLVEVAAGPVYRLLGKKDLGVAELPPLDTPIITGDLGWVYHTGGHTVSAADWTAFLNFLGKYFRAIE